jgi:aerobic carbon-monoxide dehydrogenase medium subunit
MKLPPFALHRPRSVEEALRVLSDLGDEATPYCGGTELLLAMKLGLANYAHLVDLKGVGQLRGIDATADVLRIGAAVTHNELTNSPELRSRCPDMASMLLDVANLRVRVVGTLGGNLCFADPHSDPATFLVAAGASMLCHTQDGVRRVPAEQFHTGPYQTVLESGQLLGAIEVPALPASTAIAHVRMKTHERPAVTVAARVELDRGVVKDARLVIGSVGVVPQLIDASALTGGASRDISSRVEALAEEASGKVDPLPDADGSATYKRHLVRVHVRRALSAALLMAKERE